MPLPPTKEQTLALLQTLLGEQANFRLGQWEAINSLHSGHHTLAVMPTGAGKSLIFQLAALQLDGITLVISPLIALMKDQVDNLILRNISATYINSALPATEQTRRLENLFQEKYKIVYIAPERLRNVSFLKALHSQKINLLAVDEAHCISEWGHDFRPDYLHIVQARAAFGNPLTVALTATATPQVQNDIIRLLGMGDSTARIVTGFNRPNLFLNVRYTNGIPAKLHALNKLLSTVEAGAVIIYTGTRRDAEEVVEFAREVAKIPAEFYHAGLPPDERTRIQNAFIGRNINLIAATNAFGMGIDRADVRQVIHYSLPGSLEAYYQEAGRAGRDDLPAQVTLLYDPQDRALQEFFIQQCEFNADDLRIIHNSIRTGEHWMEIDELSRVTGMHPVQLKVGLSALERAGSLEHLGDEGYRMLLRKGSWIPKEIENVIDHNKQHIAQRHTQLHGIIQYAETNTCRRKVILQHFGDMGLAENSECCDNCSEISTELKPNTEMEQENHGMRAALIILDCIRRLKIKVGQGKLAQILHGSKAKDILKFHHDKNVYYGKLSLLKQSDIENLIGQLLELGYIKIIGGEFPVVSLKPRGENAIKQKANIMLDLPKSLEANEFRRAKAKFEAGGTIEYTAKLFAGGLNPEQIAIERNFSIITIYNHLAKLIERSQITVEQVIPTDVRETINQAIRQAGATQYLAPIKSLLPDNISFEEIRCVIASLNLQVFSPTSLSTETELQKTTINMGEIRELIIQCVRSLPGQLPRSGIAKILVGSTSERVQEFQNHPLYRQLPDISRSKVIQVIDEMLEQGILTKNKNGNIDPPTADTSNSLINSFLSKHHPHPLTGSWHTGWALDFHSRFSGGDWSRSTVGDLAYQLKYQGNQTVLPTLVEYTLELFAAYPDMAQVDAILPVPPSNKREIDPVFAFCAAISDKIKTPVQSIITKTRQTQPQKEMHSLAQKLDNVKNAFTLQSAIKGRRVLLVDDLFDSGATLEEITHLLIENGVAQVNVLTITRTIHSDL
jgi:ATP-dependent DNA helicase RecQ